MKLTLKHGTTIDVFPRRHDDARPIGLDVTVERSDFRDEVVVCTDLTADEAIRLASAILALVSNPLEA